MWKGRIINAPDIALFGNHKILIKTKLFVQSLSKFTVKVMLHWTNMASVGVTRSVTRSWMSPMMARYLHYWTVCDCTSAAAGWTPPLCVCVCRLDVLAPWWEHGDWSPRPAPAAAIYIAHITSHFTSHTRTSALWATPIGQVTGISAGRKKSDPLKMVQHCTVGRRQKIFGNSFSFEATEMVLTSKWGRIQNPNLTWPCCGW